jgi:hypothetical protein
VTGLRGREISGTAPSNGQVLKYDQATNQWVASNDVMGGESGGGTVASIGAGSGLLGGPITSSGTLSVNTGTGANQIVQLDSSGKLPALDGSQLTGLDASQVSSGTLSSERLPSSVVKLNQENLGNLTLAGGVTMDSTYSPVEPQDAATKKYVDQQVGAFTGYSDASARLAMGAASATPGVLSYNSSTGVMSLSSVVTQVTGSASGGISVTAGSAPEVSLTPTGVMAGTYPVVTVDEYGRVTQGSPTLSAASIPQGSIDSSKLVSGDYSSKIAVGTYSISILGNAGTTTSLTGAFSGDVTGTQSNLTVNSLRGRSLSSIAPTNGQLLKYSGAQWSPSDLSEVSLDSLLGYTPLNPAGAAISALTVTSSLSVTGAFASVTGSGGLNLLGSSGSVVGLRAPASGAAAYTLSLPQSSGTAGQVLSSDGSGNLIWETPAGIDHPGGSVSGAIQFRDSTSEFAASSNLVWDAASSRLGVGTSTPEAILALSSTSSGFLMPRMTTAQRLAIASPAMGLQVYDTSLNKIHYFNGSAWVAMVGATGLTSFNAQTGVSQSLAVGTAGTTPSFSSSSNIHTLNLPMASAAGVTAGLLSNAEYQTLNSKVGSVAGSTLSAGQLWVGTSSNQAAAVSVSGDLSLSPSGEFTVSQIRGQPLGTSAPALGQFLKYTGGQWLSSLITGSDMRAAGSHGQLQFHSGTALGASSNLFWDTANQRLGIGTSTPATRLDVAGVMKIGTSSICNAGVLRYQSNVMSFCDGATWKNLVSPGSPGSTPWTTSGDSIYFATGNVGIGTTAPSSTLDVVGTIRGNGFIGRNSLLLSSYSLASPSSNVAIESSPNDRDSWIFRDSANAASNSGIYHRQLDDAVLGLPGNSIGFIGSSDLKSYIGLADGAAYFKGSVGVGRLPGSATLDVVGPVRALDSAAGCSTANEGAQRYHPTLKSLQFCDGTNWRSVTPSSTITVLKAWSAPCAFNGSCSDRSTTLTSQVGALCNGKTTSCAGLLDSINWTDGCTWGEMSCSYVTYQCGGLITKTKEIRAWWWNVDGTLDCSASDFATAWGSTGSNVNYSAGNVGIGSGAVAAGAAQFTLDVNAGAGEATVRVTNSLTASGPEFRLHSSGSGGTDWRLISNQSLNTGGAGNFSIYNGSLSADRLVLTPTGNLGLGTTAPGARVSFGAFDGGANAKNATHLRLYEGENGVFGFGVGSSALAYLSGSHHSFFTGANGSQGERMRLWDNGDLQLGDTSYFDGRRPLNVVSSGFDSGGSSSNTLGLFINTTNPTGGYRGVALGYRRDANEQTGVIFSQSTGAASKLVLMNANGTTPSEALFIESDGKIGLGTVTPSARLHFSNSQTADPKQMNLLRFYEDEGGNYQFGIGVTSTQQNYRADNHVFFTPMTSPTEAMRITSEGTVGIGTFTGSSAPQGVLHVKGNSGNSAMILQTSTANTANTAFDLQFANSTPTVLGGVRMANTALNQTQIEFSNWNGSARTVRMGIYGTSGNVGVATLTPVAKLDVAGPIRVGDSGASYVCNTNLSGALRYVAGALSYCQGSSSSWVTLTARTTQLTAWSSYTNTGLIVQTAANTYSSRTITGATGRVSVANGDGISGNPTIDLNTTLFPSPVAADVGKVLRVTAADTAAWSTLSNATLSAGKFWIGNNLNQAIEGTFSGDLSLGSTGAVTVTRLQGRPISATVPTTHQFLKYDGTQWLPASITGTALSAGKFWIGNDAGQAVEQTFSGDAVISNAGVVSVTGLQGKPVSATSGSNQILGLNADATAFEYKTLVGGAGITITHGAGTVTIGSTGTGMVLNPGQVWVGNSSNLSAPVSLSGDAVLSSAGVVTVTGLRGVPVNSSGLGTGQVLRFDGTQWRGAGLTSSEVTTALGYTPFNKAGDALSSLTVTSSLSVTGAMSAAASSGRLNLVGTTSGSVGLRAPASGGNAIYTVPAADGGTGQIFLSTNGSGTLGWSSITGSSLSSAKFWLGNASSQAAEVSLSGDATLSSTGVLTVTGLNGKPLSSSGSSHQVLGANSGNTGLEYKGLVAGAGMTVAPGAGAVTIGASSELVGASSVLTTGLLQRTGANSYSALAVASPLTLSASALSITKASSTTSGFLSSADWTTFNTKVNRLGDTMTGTLTLTSNGLAMAGDQLVVSGGNVGVGVATPTEKLDVGGDLNLSTGSSFRINTTAICTASGCTVSSDERLKENIEPLNGALDQILQLRGVKYRYRDEKKFGNQRQIGLIAQEVEKVYPEVVQTDSKTGLKSVAYDHLVAPLIEAVKTLYGKIQEMVARQSDLRRAIASRADEAEIRALEAEGRLKSQKIEHLEKQSAQRARELEEVAERLYRLEGVLKAKAAGG